MTGRNRIRAIFSGEPADGVGYWSGAPHPDAARQYKETLGVESDIELAVALGDDAIWIPAEGEAWRPPDGRPMWPAPELTGWIGFESLVFASAERVTQVEGFDWPVATHFDFASVEQRIREAHQQGLAVFGGPWCSVSTILMGLFGTEEMLVKMHTHPQIVEAAADHIAGFYEQAVTRFFTEVTEYPDVFFYASDLGTQQDLLMSPAMFRRFIRPALSRIADAAKPFGIPIMLHSCGSVERIIDDFVDMGITGLHPLQAKARGMSAVELARYRDRLVFVGGVDTQDLLPNAAASQVAAEVTRLKDVFGERYVVSPSHEALLPNVPLENVRAMRSAARRSAETRSAPDASGGS